MGLLRRLVDAFDPPQLEKRTTISSLDPVLARALGGLDTGFQIVNANTAENLSTVLSCVGAISSAISSLPAYVYRSTGAGREIDDSHPISRLILDGPNQHQSWPDWLEWMTASVLLRGNGISEIVSDARGAVIGLRPVPWEWCGVQLLPNGRLVYDVSQINSIYGSQGGQRRLLQDQVFHLRDRSDDGLIGRSRLQRAASVISAGLSIQQFAGSLYDNGVRPSGALELDGRLTDEQYTRLVDKLRTGYSGSANASKALILESGLHWKQISISPEDAEFLASRRFTSEELARIYNCPPPIVGDLTHGTFANTETLVRWFATNTLSPWIRKIEGEFGRSVFTAAERNTYSMEIDLSGLLRGDPVQRWQAWDIAIKNNILDANEIREIEGFNPRPAREVNV